jgi:hypothetical protein
MNSLIMCTAVVLSIVSRPGGPVVGTVPAYRQFKSRTFLCSAITFLSVNQDQMAAARGAGLPMAA